jgi:hypothetical protein
MAVHGVVPPISRDLLSRKTPVRFDERQRLVCTGAWSSTPQLDSSWRGSALKIGPLKSDVFETI